MRAKKKMASIWSLPEDVREDILLRLPVKSVMRCRCVCKPWYSFLTSSHFVKLHFRRSKGKAPNLLLKSIANSLMRGPGGHYFTPKFHSIDSERCDEAVNLGTKFSQLITTIIGSCNGVVCIWDTCKFLSLWNPATGEHFELFAPCVEGKKRSVDGYTMQRHTPLVGFGFDPDTNEYKVIIVEYFQCIDFVNIPKFNELNHFEVFVYTLGTNSWRKIESTPSKYYFLVSYCEGVHVSGALHWLGNAAGHIFGCSHSILSFNIKSEKFGEVSCPNFNDANGSLVNLGVLDGCLALSHNFRNESLIEHVDIWLMNDYGVKESWAKVFKVQPINIDNFGFLSPCCILNNGEILFLMDGKDIFIYDPVHKRATFPSVRGIPFEYISITYVESLTSIAALMNGYGVEVPGAQNRERHRRSERRGTTLSNAQIGWVSGSNSDSSSRIG